MWFWAWFCGRCGAYDEGRSEAEWCPHRECPVCDFAAIVWSHKVSRVVGEEG